MHTELTEYTEKIICYLEFAFLLRKNRSIDDTDFYLVFCFELMFFLGGSLLYFWGCFEGRVKVACSLLYPIFKFWGTYCIFSNEIWCENWAMRKAVFGDIDVGNVDVVGGC